MGNAAKNLNPDRHGEKDSKLDSLLRLIAKASTYDPGETDLDDEQPISLGLTLKEVRLARRLLRGEEPLAGLTEEVCGLARYELEEANLLESRKTNADEDLIVQEFAADIQLFCQTWVEKRLAVEEMGTPLPCSKGD